MTDLEELREANKRLFERNIELQNAVRLTFEHLVDPAFGPSLTQLQAVICKTLHMENVFERARAVVGGVEHESVIDHLAAHDTPRERSALLVEEAVRLVHGDRDADYGSPIEDFTRTAALWSGILGHPVTAQDVALCMVCVKLSRQVHKSKQDNLTDSIGYLLCLHWINEDAAT